MKTKQKVVNIDAFFSPRKKGQRRMQRARLLTTDEVAAILRQRPRTITAWATAYQDSGGKEGIRGIKIGRAWRFDEAEILALIEKTSARIA